MKTQEMQNDTVRQTVREVYGKVATGAASGCGCAPTCCGRGEPTGLDVLVENPSAASQKLGYSQADTSAVPEGSNLGLGCGNPLAIASLKMGQTVLDLGSGAGFDAFLAAKVVGSKGQVIGVDMTPEMISKARANKARGGYGNVDFRLGEIENLPVADNSVDVIISNCVINLSPDKARVFTEAWRVLKPGGRLAISDILSLKPLPEVLRKDVELYAGCVAGASLLEEVKTLLQKAGFQNIQIKPKEQSREFLREWFPGRGIEEYIVSATIEAIK